MSPAPKPLVLLASLALAFGCVPFCDCSHITIPAPDPTDPNAKYYQNKDPPWFPPPWEAKEYYRRLLFEDGMHALVSKFERGCGYRRADNTTNCTSFGDFMKHGRNASQIDRLCIQPHHFEDRGPVLNFSQFTRYANPVEWPHRYHSIWRYYGSESFPIASGSAIFSAGAPKLDWTPNFSVFFGRKRTKKGTFVVGAETFGNSSNGHRLMMFNALQRKDVNWTLTHLDRLVQDRFIVASLHDSYLHPEPIMEHPRILKIFHPQVRYGNRHRKLVPLPLGPYQIQPQSAFPMLLNNHMKTVPKAPAPKRAIHFSFTPKDSERLFLMQKVSPRFGLQDFSYLAKEKIKEGTREYHAGAVSNKYKPDKQFYKSVVAARFVPSPVGHGPDSYRIWETLSLGRVPIVKNGTLRNEILQGFPVLFVNDWDEITPQLLEQTWSRLMSDPAPRYYPERLTQCWVWKFILKHGLSTGQGREEAGWPGVPVSNKWQPAPPATGGGRKHKHRRHRRRRR